MQKTLWGDCFKKALTGGAWGRFVLCLLLGAISALSMAPYSLWFVWFFSYPLFLWCLEGEDSSRRWISFALGWSFGFGYFLGSLYWIGCAFLVEESLPLWVMIGSVFLLPSGLALYWGGASLFAKALWGSALWKKKSPLSLALLVSVSLTLAEYVRGHFFSGFPWNLPFYSMGDLGVAQWASWVGIYGGTFLLLLFSGLLGVFFREQKAWAFLGLVLIGAGLEAGGRWHLGPLENTSTWVRLVQPSIPQGEKWDVESAREIFQTYLRWSRLPSQPTPRLILWPESALPFFLERSPEARREIMALLPSGSFLVTGGLRTEKISSLDFDSLASETEESHGVFNSLLMIDSQGTLLEPYDKRFLVPFGEYMPEWLGRLGLEKIVSAPGHFQAGKSAKIFELGDGIPSFLPTICYEAIFPDSVVIANKRPQWLLNVTNDGWFGRSPGPYQHLVAARFRAIEQGIPLIRVANTGISAVIDPYGRIVAHLPLFDHGVLDHALPQALPPTPYAHVGDALFWGMMVGIVAIFWMVMHCRLTKKIKSFYK